MKYDRVGNTRRNALWGLPEKLLSILLPFLARTALIRWLGMEYAGVSGLFTSVLQLLNLMELGLGNAVVYCLYKPLAADDGDTVRALLRFYRKACRIVGGVMLGAGALLLPFLGALIRGDAPAGLSLPFVFVIYLLHSAVGYFVFPERKALLSALHRQDVLSRAALAVRVFSAMCQIFALFLTRNYHAFIAILPLAALGDSLFCARWAKRHHPGYAPCGQLSPALRRTVAEKIRGLMIHRLCGSTRNAFDSLFLSAFAGLSAVGLYGNYFYILTSVRGLTDVVTVSMSAGIGNSVAAESAEKNLRDFRNFSFLYACLCGGCTVFLLCLYQPFMTLWCGQENLLGNGAMLSFCLYFYVWTMGDVKSQYADARGLWWKDRYRSLAESLCNLLLNGVLGYFFGVTGVVLATAVSILLVGYPWSLRILFDDYFGREHMRACLRDQGVFALATAGVCAVSRFLCALLPLQGWGGLALRCGVCLMAVPGLYFLCYGKTAYFRQSLPLIRALIKR